MEAVYRVGDGKALAGVQSYGALEKVELGETSDGDGKDQTLKRFVLTAWKHREAHHS